MLTFRSPPELTARIDAYAQRNEMPRSGAIRRLVETALDKRDD
jgi:hypothetical protein